MHTESAEIALARRLEQSVSHAPAPTTRGAESITCGPFRAWFVSYTNDHQINYAIPVTPPGPDALGPAIDDLRAAFAARHRTLRIEFVEELWVGLAAALQRAGLRLQAREPLMACMKREFAPFAAPGVDVRALSADDGDADLAAFIGIGGAGPSDGSLPASAQAIAALRATLRDGSQCCALGSVSGRPAGVGRCLFQEDGLGEISSIVTLSEWRRRGVAASVVSLLIRQLIETGRSIAWLNAANEQARSLYAGLGFRSIGSLLNYEDEEPRPDRDVERA